MFQRKIYLPVINLDFLLRFYIQRPAELNFYIIFYIKTNHFILFFINFNYKIICDRPTQISAYLYNKR